MKQTAVEWLVENIREKGLVAALWNEKVFEQAKAMEKEIMHAEYMRGWKDGLTKQGPPAPPLDRKIYK